jgi:hypothetical protein
MLIATPLPASTPVKAPPVNCEPWSVLKMSGFPPSFRYIKPEPELSLSGCLLGTME